MPLQATAGSISAGPAQFAGAGWTAKLERVHYEQERWQTAGSVRGLPLAATLAEFPEWFSGFAAAVKSNGEPLRLNAEWELGAGSAGPAAPAPQAAQAVRSALPTGRLRLWRESGDLVVGALPLGMEAVSYTHLDVYKRQVQRPAPHTTGGSAARHARSA